MKNTEARIEAIHEMAAGIKARDEKRMVMAASLLSVCLLAGIVRIVAAMNAFHQTLQNDGFTGSSLLDSAVGGYVLVGVASFSAAVILTVICIRYRRR